jgi:leucyl aminopeptidase
LFSAIPTGPKHHHIVQNAIAKINVQRMEAFVSEFDNFPNRYYNGQNGVDAAAWLISQVRDVIASVPNYPGTVSASPFAHSWLQPSTIARIEGSDPILKREVVIFGAHMDSINHQNRSYAITIAPGADDNASGSVTVLETLRVLLESGFVPKRSIEFHWYAAEEGGLMGSGDIAESYYDEGVEVVAMINFDTVGYNPKGTTSIGFLTDNTNTVLTAFLRTIVDEYLVFSWRNKECGYGCSDHASFTNYGFPATCSSEIDLSPFMHTVQDTIDTVDFNQVAEFVKLAVASAIEIGVSVK